MPKNRGEPRTEPYSGNGSYGGNPGNLRNNVGPGSAGGARNAEADGSRSGSSFAARFGRTILGHGIAVVPTALYYFQGQLDLSAQLVWFVSNILSHKWDEDLPYPSLNKMAKCGGV